MKTLALAIAVGIAFAGNLRAQDPAAFTKGNEAFAAGRFDEAISAYEEAVRSGLTSANVFYNLANACNRAGQPGHAILNFERALALEPKHPEAEANLRLVRDEARALELPQTGVDRYLAMATESHWTSAAAVGFWLAMWSIVTLCFRSRRGIGAPLGLAFGLVLFGLAASAAWNLETGRHGRALAIVTVDKIQARLATADNSGTVLALPPGSEVKVLSTRGDWIYAALPNNLRGWIPASAAELVRK